MARFNKTLKYCLAGHQDELTYVAHDSSCVIMRTEDGVLLSFDHDNDFTVVQKNLEDRVSGFMDYLRRASCPSKSNVEKALERYNLVLTDKGVIKV
jgi:hypothetical protein